VRILKATIALFPKALICIDSLGECRPDNDRGLLESLRDIVRGSSTTQVCLSGRPQILDEIKRYFTDAITIPVIPTIQAIEKYLQMRLDRDTTPSAIDDRLRAEIIRVIPGTISKMCL